MSPSVRVTGGGGGGRYLPAGQIPGVYGQDDLLPNGQKIRGLNMVASEAQWAAGTAGDGWSVLWEFWDAAWIASLLDDAVSFGCNVVRMWGSIRGIWLTNYTRAEYLGYWDDFRDMCVARGLYIYAVGNPGAAEVSDIPDATLQAEMVAWATHISAWRNCIAIDLVQEDATFGASADGQALASAVRAVTTLPLTYSVVGGTGSQLGHADNDTVVTSLSTIVDFYDFHWYYDPGEDDIEQYWWNGGRTKPILIGEYGSPFSAGAATQAARYEAISTTINYAGNSGRRPAGAFAWVARDFGTDEATEMWGLSTASGTERSWITTPFQTIPKT